MGAPPEAIQRAPAAISARRAAALLGVLVVGYLLKFDTTQAADGGVVDEWRAGRDGDRHDRDRGRLVEDDSVRALRKRRSRRRLQNRYRTATWTTRGLYSDARAR